MIGLAVLAFAICSEHAAYDGASLHLEGGVTLNHELGTMQAEKAILRKEQEELPFSHMELATHVQLTLATEARIQCERAVLDFLTHQGEVTSPDKVHYVDVIKKFELFSPHIDLSLDPNGEKIKEIKARKGVHVIYDHDYHLETEAVLFAEEKITSQESNPSICIYRDDRMNAAQFDLDLTQNELVLKHPSGVFSSFSKEPLTFTSEIAICKQKKIELQGNVRISSQLQRGLADQMIYDPETKGCILKASSGKKVLFQQEKNQLQMSADEVRITYDPVSQEQAVQGVGQVTFSLSAEEKQLLNPWVNNDASSS